MKRNKKGESSWVTIEQWIAEQLTAADKVVKQQVYQNMQAYYLNMQEILHAPFWIHCYVTNVCKSILIPRL